VLERLYSLHETGNTFFNILKYIRYCFTLYVAYLIFVSVSYILTSRIQYTLSVLIAPPSPLPSPIPVYVLLHPSKSIGSIPSHDDCDGPHRQPRRMDGGVSVLRVRYPCPGYLLLHPTSLRAFYLLHRGMCSQTPPHDQGRTYAVGIPDEYFRVSSNLRGVLD
jgi:hypothetical protein